MNDYSHKSVSYVDSGARILYLRAKCSKDEKIKFIYWLRTDDSREVVVGQGYGVYAQTVSALPEGITKKQSHYAQELESIKII
jgi:hypothetical protein